MVFFGEYTVSFTSGGRLVLPKRLRDVVKGNVFVLTKGFDGCLSGYDREDWEERSKEFVSRSLTDTSEMALKRVLFSGAVFIELDDQGRFVVPKNLLDYSTLTEKVVITGVGDHFEIWSKKNWEQYLKKAHHKTQVLETV
jgi:MraZ protein